MNVVALYELYIPRLFEFGVIDSCLGTAPPHEISISHRLLTSYRMI